MGDSGTRVYDPDADHDFPDGRINEVLERCAGHAVLQATLKAQNVNPVDREGYNDHGPTHVEIVRNRALCLYDLLKAGDVPFHTTQHDALEEADEAVVVGLAATLHDVGHVVHRDRHTAYSIPIAADLLPDLLAPIYDGPTRVSLTGDILHAILCHHRSERPLTTEAGIIRVADALDMERGRSRVPYEQGGRGINTISSRAIERVTLRAGETAPVLVEIEMTNAAGVYQVDSLLKPKLEGSGLEDAVRIVAVNAGDAGEQLVERIEL